MIFLFQRKEMILPAGAPRAQLSRAKKIRDKIYFVTLIYFLGAIPAPTVDQCDSRATTGTALRRLGSTGSTRRCPQRGETPRDRDDFLKNIIPFFLGNANAYILKYILFIF